MAWAVAVPVAHAGTISVSGTTITYQANPGEANFLVVNWGNVGAGPDYIPILTDHAEITAVAPCEYDTALGAQCPTAGTNPTYVVHLGDGNDIASSTNDHAAGHSVQLYGEDGDDDLESDGSSDLLDGGPGNDELPAGPRPAPRRRSPSSATTGRTSSSCAASRPTRSPGSAATT
jgi:Ca2+-binding RTX toxin-like protein